MSADAEIGIESVSIEAVVTRADGTVEDHGTVAEWHVGDNPENKSVYVEFVKNLLGKK